MALNNEGTAKKLLRRARRGIRLLRWAAGTAVAAREDARVLLVYDFSSQPFSVGDILVMQEAALIVREERGLGKVDVALVFDPASPVVKDPAFAAVTSEDFLFHLSSVLPSAQVNPYLGSLLLFDSHAALESFIADNRERYVVWPDAEEYTSREYLFYHCFNEMFFDYFVKHGSLPAMHSRPAAARWAQDFLRKHAAGRIAATIQLRRNPANPARNSRYEAWMDFFRHCENRYPVQFVIICAPHEIDPRLRDLPNVILAKDHHTALEHDLALIEAAAFHMGASSGPSTICQFNDKPYCIFGWLIDPSVFRGITVDEHRNRFYFSSEYQNWIVAHETPELLQAEFERIWPVVQAALPVTAQP
jgi:hypothetical protein